MEHHQLFFFFFWKGAPSTYSIMDIAGQEATIQSVFNPHGKSWTEGMNVGQNILARFGTGLKINCSRSWSEEKLLFVSDLRCMCPIHRVRGDSFLIGYFGTSVYFRSRKVTVARYSFPNMHDGPRIWHPSRFCPLPWRRLGQP